MPELPEVETMVRGIRPHVVGRRIRELRRCKTACKPILIAPSLPTLARKLKGQTIIDVRRLAKRVVLDLSDGANVAIEPRMTGLMLLADPPDQEHLRLEWRLEHDSGPGSLWFWDRRGLGTVRYYRPGELAEALLTGHLGPDALQATVDHWQQICRSTRRPVKVLMLDQKRIAGIGNLYASEILHLARISPECPADQLSLDQIVSIHAATIEILNLAIQYEGSTLSDGTYRNALNLSGGYQNAHRVYDRQGERCPTCLSEVIQRIVQAQRSTFFCAGCQSG